MLRPLFRRPLLPVRSLGPAGQMHLRLPPLRASVRAFLSPVPVVVPVAVPVVTLLINQTEKPTSPVAKVVKELKAAQAKAAAASASALDLAVVSGAGYLEPGSGVALATGADSMLEAKAKADAAAAVESKADTRPETKVEIKTENTPEPKKPLGQRIKAELLHYWHGSKLLAAEFKISSRLCYKLAKGSRLTRREYRQLKRTTVDLLRLVPFLFFLIVPFMELLLPVFLKLFPNMLPSTFESKYAEEEKKKKLLKVRLEMAKFLQETVTEVSISGSKKAEAAKEFADYFRTIRSTNAPATTASILEVTKKFPDELTLNNLSRPQLVSMCKYMNINAFGTDNFLRYQIRRRMEQLARDDKMIAAEGVDSLTVTELQHACTSRGIRTIGVSPARMREELSQWLELHLKHEVPSALLILSRAFLLSDRLPSEEESVSALKATLSSLPDSVVNETVLHMSELEGSATYKQKLEVIEQQEEMIADELEQEAAEAAARAATASAASATSATKAAPGSVKLPPEAPAARMEDDEESIEISEDELVKIGDAISVMSAKSAVDEERRGLEELRGLRGEFKEDLSQLNELKAQAAATHAQAQAQSEAQVAPLKIAAPESSGVPAGKETDDLEKEFKSSQTLQSADGKRGETMAPPLTNGEVPPTTSPASAPPASPPAQDKITKSLSRLDSRLDKLVSKIEVELEAYDSEIGSKMNLIQPAADGKISVDALEEALKVIRDHPEDERIKKIVRRLDADGDGLVTMEEIRKLVERGKEVPREGYGIVVGEKDK